MKGRKKIILQVFLMIVLSVAPSIMQAQNQKIKLDGENLTLKMAFEQIEKQTGLSVDYDTKTIDVNKVIKTIPKPGILTTVLTELLKGTNCVHTIKQSHIIISISKPIDEKTKPANKNSRITGSVVDEKGEPIIGANVWVKETASGVTTDLKGKFSLPASKNSVVLVISYMGYTKAEIEVREPDDLGMIKLTPSSGALDEFVVVGYGYQKRESVIGAIATIKPDDLKVPSGQLSNILAGRLSGVISINRSGEPGNGSDFYIRGISTFGANQKPLIIVDGIERSLDLVDPEDIASFSILKDATATAVYGVRGANGVVIISTRAGFEGKPKINARYEEGISGPTQLPKMADAVQYAQMYNEASDSKYFSDEAIQAYKDNSNPDLYPNVNWIQSLYNDFAPNHRLNLNFSGGNSVARYYVAGSIYNEGSIFKNESDKYNSALNYKKINFRANIDLNITKSTILNVNLTNIYETKTRPNASLADIWDYTFSMSPNAFPMVFSNGYLAGTLSGDNPYNQINYSGYANDYVNSSQSLVGLTQDFGRLTKGLKANVKFSWDAYNSGTVSRQFKPQTWLVNGVDSNGDIVYSVLSQGAESLGYSNSLDGRKTTYLESSLTYDRTFGKHHVGGLFLYNQKKLNYLNSSTALGSLPYKNQGVAGRVTYSFDDRYFAEYNMGYNGSENFAAGHRFGFFPAFAGGWMVSNEKFWEPLKRSIDLIKIRGSYGIVGNDQIGGGRRFIYQETIVEGGTYLFGETGNYAPGSLRMGDVSNPNVSWEKSYKMDIGLEISFFNMIKIQADYFHDRREGIFIQRGSLTNMAGISVLPWVNIGKMENGGFDGSLQFNKKVGDFSFTALANFTYAHNNIIDNDQPDYQYAYQSRIGKPYGQRFGLIALGIFNSQEDINQSPAQFGTLKPGDIKYKDVNNDNVVDQLDQVAIGYTTNPEIVYGFGETVGWKGIDLSVFFQGVAHTTIQMSGIAVYGFSGALSSVTRGAVYEDVILNRWSLENQDPMALYPRITIGDNPNNNQLSTLRLRDGSFIRLKNIELGYTIPKKYTAKLHISALRFYTSGVNILTFSKFKIWDPELGSGDGSTYPLNRNFVLGVNINF